MTEVAHSIASSSAWTSRDLGDWSSSLHCLPLAEFGGCVLLELLLSISAAAIIAEDATDEELFVLDCWFGAVPSLLALGVRERLC
jgi:hypothetical protein